MNLKLAQISKQTVFHLFIFWFRFPRLFRTPLPLFVLVVRCQILVHQLNERQNIQESYEVKKKKKTFWTNEVRKQKKPISNICKFTSESCSTKVCLLESMFSDLLVSSFCFWCFYWLYLFFILFFYKMCFLYFSCLLLTTYELGCGCMYIFICVCIVVIV